MSAAAGGRILMLLGNNPYPQDPRVRAEATSLTDAGYSVSVICPSANGQPRQESVDGVRVYRYRNPFPAPHGFFGHVCEFAFVTLATLALSFRVRGGFDVVHAHNPPDTFVLVALVHKLRRKRFVFDHHDLAPEMYRALFNGREKRLVVRVLTLFERLSCRLADLVITTNESYRRMALERTGVAPERVTVVRNGPDLNRLQPTDPDPELRRRATTIIGYVGNIGFHDGVDHLLRALRHLVTDCGYDDVLCFIIGDGDALSDAKRLAGALELDRHVLFTGFVPSSAVSRYLCAADICVDPDPSNPYNDRSTMIKIAEYMALGRPIVAFDLPEHRVTAGDAAVYVTPNDDREFAEALAALIADPERRDAMGACGRSRVLEQFAWTYSIPPLVESYVRLFSD